MFRNEYKITSLDKQIILLSKNWFNNYLEENKIEKSTIEILRYMVAEYVGSDVKHIGNNDVYYWVKNLYCYLSDSGKCRELSTKDLLDRIDRVLNTMWNTNKTQSENLIETLLGGISCTRGTELDELGIELDEPDYSFLKDVKCIKDGLALICSAKNDEMIMVNVKDMKGDFIITGGGVYKLSCINKRLLGIYEIEDIEEVDFKDIYNIRYVKKVEVEVRR
jgi:hypothetical protein